MRSVIFLFALLAIPLVIGTPGGPDDRESSQLFKFADSAIVESSGLVIDDDLFMTTNDSGDRGRVFTVDETGATVGVTEWTDAPTDVEALAPAGPGEVWVGDIGDNRSRRSSISVSRIPVGRGDQVVDESSYTLAYSDGAHDAEALLADPSTGRLYVATKGVFGGKLYAAPQDLDPDGRNVLRPVGDVGGIVTDGAFFPDGRHLVLRDYSRATVYTFPELREVGDLDLPDQPQGEAIAVADDHFYVSSEGRRATVYRVGFTEDLQKALAGVGTTAPASPTAVPTDSTGLVIPSAQDTASVEAANQGGFRWLVGGALGLVVVVILLGALRPR